MSCKYSLLAGCWSLDLEYINESLLYWSLPEDVYKDISFRLILNLHNT